MSDLNHYKDPISTPEVNSGIPYNRFAANYGFFDFIKALIALMKFYQSKNTFPNDIIMIPNTAEKYLEKYRSDFTQQDPDGRDPRIITYDLLRSEPASDPPFTGKPKRIKPYEGPDGAIYEMEDDQIGKYKVKEYILDKDNLLLFSFYAQGSVNDAIALMKLFENFLFYNEPYINIFGIMNYSNMGMIYTTNPHVALHDLTGYYRKSIYYWFRSQDKYMKLAEPVLSELVISAYQGLDESAEFGLEFHPKYDEN